MVVDLFDSVRLQAFSGSSMEVLVTPRWWYSWFFWQLKCGCTMMLKDWPGCFDDLLSIYNVSHSRDLSILSAKFLLCHTLVSATLPHRQKVIDLFCLVQLLSRCLFLRRYVFISTGCLKYSGVASEWCVIGSRELCYYIMFAQGPAFGLWLPAPDLISPTRLTGLHSNVVRYDKEYVACHIGVIGALCVHFFLLETKVGDIR